MNVRSRFITAAIAAVVVLAIVVGCGASPDLELITLSPKPASGTVGGADVQFTATGTYSDSTTRTNTGIDGLTWTSSDPATASITSTGLARCLLAGVVTITASAPGKGGTQSDTSQLTCTTGP